MKRVIISVSNDLVSDQRVHKVARTLQENGYNITLVGRRLKNSLAVKRQYNTKRFKLFFNKGPLFYVCLNCRLFFYLLFAKADIFLSNDLDTLLANYITSKIRRKKLVYDSHEYFTEVPELKGRNFVRNRWLGIEKSILPKLEYTYTVCDSVSSIYNDKYGINMQTIRNVPYLDKNILDSTHEVKTIIYQGSLNVARGLEEIIRAMKYIDNCILHIVGSGDIDNALKELVKEEGVEDKVQFFGKIPFSELKEYTVKADIGISLEQDISLNYFYSLPNKIFDYIHAGVPILASKFPEMENIINKYEIGLTVSEYDPFYLASIINEMLSDKDRIEKWKKNLAKASEELNWQIEEKKLIRLFNSVK